MADRKLVVRVGSTVELPFEPDPGSCGSSSCVSIFSRYTSEYCSRSAQGELHLPCGDRWPPTKAPSVRSVRRVHERVSKPRI